MSFFILQRTTLIAVLVALLFTVAPVFVEAQQTGNPFPNTGTFSPKTGAPGGTAVIESPLKVTSLCDLFKQIFTKIVIPLGIPVAVLYIIWSGVKFVLAQGNQKELAKARQNFFYTVIGIAIFLGAWLLAIALAETINAVGGANIISCR